MKLPNVPIVDRIHMRLTPEWHSYFEHLQTELIKLEELDTENASLQLKVLALESKLKDKKQK
jgi:hypothetical protein